MIKGVIRFIWDHLWFLVLVFVAYAFYQGSVQAAERERTMLDQVDFGDVRPIGLSEALWNSLVSYWTAVKEVTQTPVYGVAHKAH